MNFFYGFFLVKFFFIQCLEDLKYKLNTLYLEYDNRYFNASIIESQITIELLKQVPLNIGQFSNYNERISFTLDKHINNKGEEKIDILKKGDIYTDGDHLLFYYGNSNEKNINDYYFIGNVVKIDDFIKSLIDKPFKNLNIKEACTTSILRNNLAYISKINPSFYITSYLPLDNMPNLYFGYNNIPLDSYCEFSENKKHEINCTFSEDEIKKNYFEYINNLTLYEIIIGCQEKINTRYNISFIYNIPHCQKQDTKIHRCIQCEKSKKLTKDGKGCVYSSSFYYMVIGLPIINVFLISFSVVLCKIFWGEKDDLKFISFSFIFILLLVNIISIGFYFG